MQENVVINKWEPEKMAFMPQNFLPFFTEGSKNAS